MQWFRDAKLGIFIHWEFILPMGVDESWSFYNHKLPYENIWSSSRGLLREL
ncbi:MAG: alpha-L-fucosidase [Saprospiraceae bacterium]|nr:alpha-L-fucosidase [Candidatus Parvibacillus calidus]